MPFAHVSPPIIANPSQALPLQFTLASMAIPRQKEQASKLSLDCRQRHHLPEQSAWTNVRIPLPASSNILRACKLLAQINFVFHTEVGYPYCLHCNLCTPVDQLKSHVERPSHGLAHKLGSAKQMKDFYRSLKDAYPEAWAGTVASEALEKLTDVTEALLPWDADSPYRPSPVPGVPVMDGFGCSECSYASPSRETMLTHLYAAHGSRRNGLLNPCRVQTIFTKPHIVYRQVTERESRAPLDVGSALRSTFSKLGYLLPSRLTGLANIENKRHLPPLLTLIGFPTYISAIPEEQIVTLASEAHGIHTRRSEEAQVLRKLVDRYTAHALIDAGNPALYILRCAINSDRNP